MAANSNYNNGISPEQAAQALLAAGFLIDFNRAGQGIALHNDADVTYYIGEEQVDLRQFCGDFEVFSKHELADCSIEDGSLVLGPAVSTKIFE